MKAQRHLNIKNQHSAAVKLRKGRVKKTGQFAQIQHGPYQNQPGNGD
jgi:hypothetical protein